MSGAFSNEYWTKTGALQFVDNSITATAKNAGDARQYEVFQPIDLVSGYSIPDVASDGFDRSLSLPLGYRMEARNTVSNWAILNAHLLYKNVSTNMP